MADMSTYTYKNTSSVDLIFVGVGLVEAGATIESNDTIEHPHMELVNPDERKTPKQKTVNKEDNDESGDK